MRIATILLSLSVCGTSFAQKVVDVSTDARLSPSMFFVSGGEPFVTTKFVNLVEGTPYFKAEWMKGIVVDKSDRQYKDIKIKIDLIDNSIHYLDDKETEFVATVPIKEIVLSDAANNYRFIHSSAFENAVNTEKNRWYQWLASGSASLYKKFEKDLSEFKGYGASTVEQHIKTHEKYLIFYNNSFLEVKKIKDVPSVLANKKKELEDFLKKSDDEKASMDDRMVKLIEYYNSLVKDQKT